MNISTRVKGNWHELKGTVKEKWGKITDNEIDKINGQREKLVGLIMKKYDLTKEIAERQVNKVWH